MGGNGMNVNGANKSGEMMMHRFPMPKLNEEQKIIIDFMAMQSDNDIHHLTVDEVLRKQVDEYARTGQLPKGKTIAEFLMDVQNAVEKYAGKDKQLNIDEYSAMLKTGVELARPSSAFENLGDSTVKTDKSAKPELSEKQKKEFAEMEEVKRQSEHQKVYEQRNLKLNIEELSPHEQPPRVIEEGPIEAPKSCPNEPCE